MNALRKYGEDAFEFFELARFSTADEAFAAEKRVIALLNPEYNICEGGYGGSPWAGKQRSDETKAKISATKKGCKAPPVSILMQESRAKNCIKAAKARQRPVVCVTDGKEYVSVSEAAQVYGTDKAAISAVCRGKRNSWYGRVFRFKGA